MPESPLAEFERVIHVLSRLLDPDGGCPWDLKQTPESARLYLLEETYELMAAMEDDDPEAVREEMGDCFFMLMFLMHLVQREGKGDMARVIGDAADKMIARHPHIFGEGRKLESAEEVKDQWNRIKRRERPDSILAGVPRSLPGLLRSHRLTERAGRAGFDWDEAASVLDSLDGELAELKEAVRGGSSEEVASEMGDVLFTAANLARHLKVNAEDALRGANERFRQRFQHIEERLAARGRTPEDASLDEMDELWEEAKAKGY